MNQARLAIAALLLFLSACATVEVGRELFDERGVVRAYNWSGEAP